MKAGRQRNRMMAAVAILAVAAAIPAVNAVRDNAAHAAGALSGDGTSSATAGASCWGIKQQYPASATGTFWLNTLGLERPTQFFCDMTTDGGGWVLVGRGRQGWTFNPSGQGSATTVRTTTDGTGAFSPAALSTDTISGLLDGTAVKDLPDGIRVERATNTSGSSRQDYRLFMTTSAWTWSFHAGQLLSKVVIGNKTYSGSNTQDTAASVPGQNTNGLSSKQGTDRLFTMAWTNHANLKGFSLGSGVNGGSSSSSNFLWTSSNEGSPIPFARVWIRPRIANDAAGFTPIPSSGYTAQPKPVELKSKSEVAPFGVVGLDHTGETSNEPYNTNVLSMRAIGNTMFVGGRFTGVQQGPSSSPVTQKYLASFDLAGNWDSGFRPTLDGRVFDMVAAPDGNLVIAGDFTNVNGTPDTAGIAKLDPTTGAVVAGFKANVTKPDGTRAIVRSLAEADGWIYAAGVFNRYTGGTWNVQTVSSAISLRNTDGSPGTWRPRLPARAVRLRVTKDKTKVLLAGYFSNINGDTNMGYFGITDIATGAPSPGIGAWTPSGGAKATYQQAVADLGDGRYLVGGSEHDFQLWNSSRTQLIDSTITKQGGDTQAIELANGKAYFSCHCANWVYEGTNNWTAPQGFRAVEQINLVAAVDQSTFAYDTNWYPAGLKGSVGEGVWAIEPAADGCLWVGGDLVKGAYSGNAATDWLGGFARFCQEDATAPTAPSSLKASLSGNTVSLSWAGSSDASGTVSYDVYRNDRVIATVWGTSFSDPELVGSARYTVRASDARGNRSASPAPIAVNGPAPKIATVLAFGSTWKYNDDGSDQGTAWRGTTFADSAWSSGKGQLGWGVTSVTNATTLGPVHPITAYFRSSFSVADPTQAKTLNLRTKVFAGSVVYVNGVEVSRYNMPSGAISSTTVAAGYLTTAEESAIGSVIIPGSLLKAGANTIAVEVHSNKAGATRSWFDLEATTYGTGADTAPPTAPSLTATVIHPNVNLSWTPSTDENALGGYLVARDGQPYAVAAPDASSYVDGSVDTATSHTYQVTAFDNTGNKQGSNVVTLAPAADPNLLTYGSTWKWTFPAAGLADGWQGVGFDDSTWATGSAELGFGDGDEKTIITTAAAPRPITAYFRATVTITNPALFQSILADLIRDDGAVIYVNGVEVGRDNMPAGPVTGSTVAPVALTTRAQETMPASISIPASAFHAGANTIAVEVHGTDKYTGDLSFDLRLTGKP
ncbi:MAG: hypothetical protein JWM89_1726 [Acidimicrobiales bacterium]|nr:hypothetical protein [Acidimicrobiales bacterium]